MGRQFKTIEIVLKIKRLANKGLEKSKVLIEKGSKGFVNELFPPSLVCLDCGKELRDKSQRHLAICDACQNHLPYRKGRHCKYCGAYIIESDESTCSDCKVTPPEFKEVLAPFENKGVVKRMLDDYKRSGMTYLYIYIARHMTNYFRTSNVTVDYVLYIPQTRRQNLARGFDHLKLITKFFVKATGIPQIQPLYKTKNVPEFRPGEDRVSRYENVYGVFSMLPEFDADILKDKSILVIDDILNSGATENACARVLKENGAKSVTVLTFIRV
ncbi:MAG: double zinc ribbon domain-containing protein [Christensenellaceae bacterium]|jgi:predicted amidophosphoribosyltransferase|nr:double zinc ribbon domain-containing protein [Christensenellaceae bacterium]